MASQGTRPYSGPELIAHRGASRERPENTIAAFERALELGATGIELDIHGTADGVPVVHHDPALVEGGRPIAALTLAELRAEVISAGKEVPLLAEVLDVVGARADLYVELKGRGVEREVLDVLRRAPRGARYAIHSFDHRSVARSRSMEPSVPGGILLVSYVVDIVSALRAADARDCWMWWEMIDAPLVDAVHSSGGRVIAWTVNSGEAAAALTALGVDGICTDDVPLVRAARGGSAPR